MRWTRNRTSTLNEVTFLRDHPSVLGAFERFLRLTIKYCFFWLLTVTAISVWGNLFQYQAEILLYTGTPILALVALVKAVLYYNDGTLSIQDASSLGYAKHRAKQKSKP